MAQITAAAVAQLRKETGLPMMECKQALAETSGDPEKAKQYLREKGLKTQATRLGRETDFGRLGLYTDLDAGVGAMVELKCESAPVASNEEVVQFAADLAEQLATGPGAATPEELLDQPSPSKAGRKLSEQKDDLFNRIREVFNVGRMVRFEGRCGGYVHSAGKPKGALLQFEGGNAEAAKDVCMHIVAGEAEAVSQKDLDPAVVEQERAFQVEQAKKEGKPDNIVDKIVEGRMRNWFAERVLVDQPFVKDESITVGQYAEQAGMKLIRFVRWELGKE